MFTLESETGKRLKIKAPNFRGEPRFTTKTASTAWKKEGLLFMHGRRELWDISNVPDVKGLVRVTKIFGKIPYGLLEFTLFFCFFFTLKLMIMEIVILPK